MLRSQWKEHQRSAWPFTCARCVLMCMQIKRARRRHQNLYPSQILGDNRRMSIKISRHQMPKNGHWLFWRQANAPRTAIQQKLQNSTKYRHLFNDLPRFPCTFYYVLRQYSPIFFKGEVIVVKWGINENQYFGVFITALGCYIASMYIYW